MALYFALVYAESTCVLCPDILLIQKPIMQFCAFQEPAKGMRKCQPRGKGHCQKCLATKSLVKNAFVALQLKIVLLQVWLCPFQPKGEAFAGITVSICLKCFSPSLFSCCALVTSIRVFLWFFMHVKTCSQCAMCYPSVLLEHTYRASVAVCVL